MSENSNQNENQNQTKIDQNSLELSFNLFNYFPSLVWRTSPIDAKCNYVNKAWLDFTGRTLGEELGDGWMDQVHPDDLQMRKDTYSNAFKAQQSFEMEYRLKHKDGTYHWVNDHGNPFYNHEKKFLGFIGSCYDITTRKKGEQQIKLHSRFVEKLAKDLEKFKLALANASDQIVISNKEGTVIYVNAAIETITGYSPQEVIGMKAGALWKLPMPAPFYEKMWKTIKEDKLSFKGDLTNRRKNGEIYEAQMTISPILDNKGEVLFFVSISRDVTKEKQIDKAKSEFVSLASHQLRTPLSSINWYAEMLLAGDAGPITEDQKTFLEEVYQSNKRMIDLVNALLNVSRIDLGTFAIDPQPTDLVELSKSVLKEIEQQIKTKEIEVTENYDKALPIMNVDQNLTRMIFQNLLTNAIKYTPEKGKVSLDVIKEESTILIKVADTGYGIPDKDKDKIFSKLFRAENARDKVTDGTGLGLYIIKSIVDQSKGKTWFESVENKGTTFYVQIPIAGMPKKEGTKGLDYKSKIE